MTFQFATRKEELQSTYWEFYKEIYNVRPRWMNFDAMSEAELVEALDRLEEQAKAVYAQREEDERAAIARFEQSVTETIANGAGTREVALRWLMSAENIDDTSSFDVEHYCYLNGLPYTYFKKVA
jgi:hypothetical protein